MTTQQIQCLSSLILQRGTAILSMYNFKQLFAFDMTILAICSAFSTLGPTEVFRPDLDAPHSFMFVFFIFQHLLLFNDSTHANAPVVLVNNYNAIFSVDFGYYICPTARQCVRLSFNVSNC